MMKHRYTTTTCCGVLAAALVPLAAGAQQTATLEEVIVTAQKREERLQDVALSLSVVDESTISDAGVSEVDDIVMLTPGLDFSQTLGRQNTTPLIRGVAPTFLTDPTVVVLTDGFTLGFTRLVNNALLSDLERIEVLKGPQATLYGRNALGGVINYVTKRPSETAGGSVSAEYGSYESYQVSGSITGPIVADHLFGRLTVGTRSMGGYLDNRFDGAKDVNDERDLSVRGSLRWLATDSLEIDLATTYGKGEDGCGDCSHIPRTYDRLAPDRFLRIGRGELDFNDNDLTTDMSFPGSYDREDLTAVLTGTYTQPSFIVTSIAGYGRIESELNGDSNGPGVGTFIPGVPGYTVPIDIDGWSEELRISSNGDDRLTWLTGLYAYRSSTDSALRFGPAFLTNSDRQITNYAGFANAEYGLTDHFSIAAGLRYDYEEQEFRNNEHLSLSGAVSLMHSELKEFEDPIVAPRFGVNQDLAGNELPFAPEVSGKVGGQYLVPIGAGGWQMRLRTDVRYMGSRFFEPVNLIEADAYWLANVYAGVQNEHYEIGIYADNVLDEEYLTGGTLPDPVFPAEVTLGTPRMYGLRVSARF